MQENYYKSILMDSPIGYAYHKLIVDDKGLPIDYVFIEVNNEFQKITGLDADNIIGKRVTEVFPSIKQSKFDWINYYGNIALNCDNKTFEQFAEPQGKWFKVNVFSKEKGYFTTLFIDISEEKNKVEEIQRFFDVNLDLLCIANTDGYFLKLNKQWETTLGYSLEELVNRKFINFVHPEDIESTIKVLEQLSDQKPVVNIVNRYRCKDGSYKHIEWRSHPQGKLIYAAARDVSDKVREEQALKNIIAYSEEFLQLYDKDIDYDKITKDFCNLADAKLVAFNLYEEDGQHYCTKSLYAESKLINRGSKMLGDKILGKKWPHDPIRAERIKDNILTEFESLASLAGYTYKPTLLNLLIRTFSLGACYILKIMKGGVMIGDFTFIMSKGKQFKSKYIAEVLSRQLGMVIVKKRVDDALKRSEEKYRLITENASDVIWVLNITQNRYTFISPSILHLRGLSVEEALNENFINSVTPESYERIKLALDRNVHKLLKNPVMVEPYILEIQQFTKSGEIIWVEVSTRLSLNKDNEIEVIGVSRNIEERKKNEKEIIFLSYHDQLTGLYNRRFFEEELKRLDVSINLPLTLIMIDVNGLKLINDAFGHASGDQVLIKAAEIMRQECRKDDIIARIGGDEFMILLPSTTSEDAENIAKRINHGVNQETVEGINLSISYGWETKIESNRDIMEVLKEAENYMYRQKLSENQSIRHKTVDIIIKTLYEKSPREEMHSKRVGKLCGELGLALGLSSKDINELITIGTMHDIGKIAIADEVLNKPSRLTVGEAVIMKRHSEIGYRILSAINEYAQSAEYVLAHHERMDGSGYPKKLTGDNIPFQSRIIAIADAYDAMTSDRPYRAAMAKEDAIKELIKHSGKQFDTKFVNVFIEKVLSK